MLCYLQKLMLNCWRDRRTVGVLSILWALLILFLSSMPGKDLPRVDLIHIDKLAHLIVYLILFLLLAKWMSLSAIQSPLIKAFLLVSLYGISMEWMQGTFFPERYFDWYDAASNAVGAGLGIVIFRHIP